MPKRNFGLVDQKGMFMDKRVVFFISDSTGITANTLGQSLLAQFEILDFKRETIPYVKNIDAASKAVEKINHVAQEMGVRPIVFSTLIEPQIRYLISTSNAFVMDLFQAFIEPLELELNAKSSHAIGRSHTVNNSQLAYERRMEAVNFALQHDDGASVTHYRDADVILVGVSRSGKTPTCVYLAMHYGVSAANYPLAEEDVVDLALPEILRAYKDKLFGLTIKPDRLQKIRQERRPNSRYSSLVQCQLEVQRIEALFRKQNIPFLNTTTTSVEELATQIVQQHRFPSSMF